jgi:glycosyltransferase involved in cell wall biosynthesis
MSAEANVLTGGIHAEPIATPAAYVPAPLSEAELEISVVMPCLNEIGAIHRCVEKAWQVIHANNLRGEVVVADNGSTDGSIEAAQAAGARVVHQPLRGYGHAYMKGMEEAHGRYILMADADNTYDFGDLPKFLALLRQGYDVVMGNRFRGKIYPGAMPWSHRYIGNPILSGLLNLFFHTGVGDAHSGMRACTKDAYAKMRLQTGGMEFASEMVINAAKAGLKMTEVPINYYQREGESKLDSVRDGWRHLRFMLLYSPTHLYFWPGATMMLIGLALLVVLNLGPVSLLGVRIGFPFLFVGSLLAILGFQIISLGFFARLYSLTSHIDVSSDSVVGFFTGHFRMETGIFSGLAMFTLGAGVFLFALLTSEPTDPLGLPLRLTLISAVKLAILALTLAVIGAQVVFTSFFVSMMVIKRSGWEQLPG